MSPRTTAITLAAAFALAGAALLAVPAWASQTRGDPAARILVIKSGCFTCHALDRKLAGPSFRSIARRYRHKRWALARLTKKVETGGPGHWGKLPMEPHPDLTRAQIRSMVRWVLAQ